MPSAIARRRFSRSTRRGIGATELLALLTAAAIPSPAIAQSRGFTIDDALSAPFPGGLTAAPAGGRVAWIFDAEGSRNIWIGEPGAGGAFTSRQLTRFQGDIGIEIGTPTWSADGGRVFFERGGEPNPESLPLGTEPEQLWTMALSDTAPTLIGNGSGAAVAPDGKRLAYAAGRSMLLASVDGSGKPQTVVRDLGRVGSLAWSPDGSRIAFASFRGTHNLVGVYDLGRKSLTWLEPSVDRDGSPIWSPDGAHVAFIRDSHGGAGPVHLDPDRRAVVDLDRRRRAPARAGSSGRRTRAPAASITASRATRPSSGAPTTGSSFRGRGPVGSISTASRPPAGRPPCSRRATSRSSAPT